MKQADFDKVNGTVRKWKNVSQKELVAQFTILKIEHLERSPSLTPAVKLLKNKVGYNYGLASRISFKFPKHMVFVHKGVGRGGDKGRTAKPWFNTVMDKQVEKFQKT